MKKSEAAELVMMLIGAFPNAKTAESTSQVYETMLADLDAALVRRAVTRLIATSKFLPTVAEVRSAYAELVQSERAALARARAARIPSLTRTQLAERDARLRLAGNNRASTALVVPKGAAASSRESSPAPTPADLLVAPPRPPRAPAREPRRWTAEELDAELARSAGGTP